MPTQSVPPTVRNKLEAERKALLSQLGELGFGDTGRLSYDSNFADTSQVTAERGEAAALASSLQEGLDEVEHALAKIEAGTFGACENCDNAIPETRLEAMPTGRLCMKCASGR